MSFEGLKIELFANAPLEKDVIVREVVLKKVIDILTIYHHYDYDDMLEKCNNDPDIVSCELNKQIEICKILLSLIENNANELYEKISEFVKTWYYAPAELPAEVLKYKETDDVYLAFTLMYKKLDK